MKQISFKTDDFLKCKDYLTDISRSRDYRDAKSILVQLCVDGWDSCEFEEYLDMTCTVLPKAEVCGMTDINHDAFMMNAGREDASYGIECIDINILFFFRSSIQVIGYDFDEKKICNMTAGAHFSQLLTGMEQVKAVMLLASLRTDVEDFLSMASAMADECIPFFGAQAAGVDGGHEIMKEFTKNYILDGMIAVKKKIFSEGIVCVVFRGEDLHIHMGYNFGWTPIGRKMTITKMLDSHYVEEIDDAPAIEIYGKYLGLKPDQITPQNICEFPFAIEREDRLLGRIGVTYGDNGGLMFAAPVVEEEELRLTYGNPNVILHESFEEAMRVYEFRPEALISISCINRSVLLQQDISVERNFFSMICPNMAVHHGNAEIIFDGKGGGLLNSALVTFAMREGSAEEVGYVDIPPEAFGACLKNREEVPMVQRLITFLQATTSELGDALKAAKEANRAKSDFLSSVSHEIRTPINAILGMDEMILRESHEDNVRHYAVDIKNSSRILLSLINDLLDSSRIEAGRMELLPVEYELSSALNDLVNMISYRAKEKNLAFHVQVDKNIPHILYGDDTRLRQCVINILTNAVKYTREGSVTLKVKYDKVDNAHIKLGIAVEDTGIGIKKEDIDALFAPFERIEENRNRHIEGTGLGMSIVKALLSMMDSELKVESEYGKGSIFSFEVLQRVVNWEPVGDFEEMYANALEVTEEYQEAFRAPEAKILVVDDTAVNLTVIKGLLKETRIQVDTAPGGVEAIGMVQKIHYDVIFLDQRMPDMDGIETRRRMKHLLETENRDTPVIMLTANAVSGAREKFLAEGFDDYLTKPVNGKKLELTLMRFLPEEKVIRGEKLRELENDEWYSEGGAETEENLSELVELLSEDPEMDVQSALANCMNEEILEETIRDFVEAARKNPDKIERFLENGDVKGYTILVHALKSSSRIIGLGRLSAAAEELEMAGDAMDMDIVRRDTPMLLKLYREQTRLLADVLEKMEDAQEEEQDDDTKVLIPEEQLKGAFSAVREFVEAFDYDGAGDVLGMLKDFRLSEEDREKAEKVSSYIRALERDKILKILKG